MFHSIEKHSISIGVWIFTWKEDIKIWAGGGQEISLLR